MNVRDRRVRVRPILSVPADEKKRVDSSFKAESNINVIVARWLKTGLDPAEHRRALAQFRDVSDSPSFVEMQEIVRRGADAFARLPAKVRKFYDNDPAQFLQAAETKEGLDEIAAMGLDLRAPEAPTSSSAVPEPTKGAPKAPKGAKGNPAPVAEVSEDA